MADASILTTVKKALGITDTYQDDTLNVYIDEVISYMVDAGVPSSVVKSPASAGVISRGVTDLWNYGSAGGKLSDYFYQRVSQLNYEVDSEIDTLKREIAELQEQVKLKEQEVAELQQELDAQQVTIDALRSEITVLQGQIAAKQSIIEALELQVTQLTTDKVALQEQVIGLNAEKAEMQQQHAEEVAAIEQENAKAIEELERTHAEQIEALEEENATEVENSYNEGYQKGFDDGNDNVLFTNHGTMYKKNMVVKTDHTDGFFAYAYRYADKMETLDVPFLQSIYTAPSSVFQGCTSLKRANLPRIMRIGVYFFRGCTLLEDITLGETDYPMELIETSSLQECPNLKRLSYIGVIPKSLNLQWSSLLTHDSLMSIINALEDKSEDTSGTTWTLTIGSENLAKLDEATELAIAWQKGWVVV